MLAGLLAIAASAAPGNARAASAPNLGSAWSTEVVATSARLHAEVNPQGLATTYHFEYLTEAAFQSNQAAGHEAFAGALRAPAGAEASAGGGSSLVHVSRKVTGLTFATAYRYRVVAKNTEGVAAGEAHLLVTQGLGGASPLLDGRAWEMVSPADKNGGQVAPPETLFGGGDLQAAAGGNVITFSSSASFGEGASGAPPASQYVSTRTASGWATRNVTLPTMAGSYGDEPDGVPYRLFSTDLARALLLNGRRCAEGEECPRSYSLLEPPGTLGLATPEVPDLRLAGATPDLRHVVFRAEGGLYKWSGASLETIDAGPGAELAAPAGAISEDGSRVYWHQLEGGPLWLDEAGQSPAALPETTGGSAAFQVASADGAFAFYATSGGALYRYSAQDGSRVQVAPAVDGVLGASAGGSVVYYQTPAGLYRWSGGTVTEVAAGADAAAEGNWPPATGTARVSADGSALAFLSAAPLTGYDNTDQSTGQPDTQLFLWRAGAGLVCVSCNPTNQRPIGPSSIPGAVANGSNRIYKPRSLVAGGRRLFFESDDSLVLSDTNVARDVYEWEAQGEGDCAAPDGCLGLVSSGKAAEGATFVDASQSGADAYFLTARSLVGNDHGSTDLYDAREGGGFPEPESPIPCEGDACQSLPSEPDDPQPGTLLPNSGNPASRLSPPRCPKGKRRVKRHGRYRCIPRHRGKGDKGGRR
jgi:hypothetical protein